MQREEIEKMAKEGVKGADKMLEILDKYDKAGPKDWKTTPKQDKTVKK